MCASSSKDCDFDDDELDLLMDEFSQELKAETPVSKPQSLGGKHQFKLKWKLTKHIETKKSPYIFYEISEIENSPVDMHVKVVGICKYSPEGFYMTNFCKIELDSPTRITLDMQKVKKYPPDDNVVEVCGAVHKDFGKFVIMVHWFKELGYDEDKIEEYLQLLRRQKKMCFT